LQGLKTIGLDVPVLPVALAVMVLDVLRHRTPQVVLTQRHQLAQALGLGRQQESPAGSRLHFSSPRRTRCQRRAARPIA
jgi:hypothetical protein